MHPTLVVGVPKRVAAALAVALTLGAAGWTECAGWQLTPEARMDCCTDIDMCPMHRGVTPGSPSGEIVTQSKADSCCAASDSKDSTPSAEAFSLVLPEVLAPSSLLAPVTVPPASLHVRRAHIPLRGHVPKHVLLSVFLI